MLWKLPVQAIAVQVALQGAGLVLAANVNHSPPSEQSIIGQILTTSPETFGQLANPKSFHELDSRNWIDNLGNALDKGLGLHGKPKPEPKAPEPTYPPDYHRPGRFGPPTMTPTYVNPSAPVAPPLPPPKPKPQIPDHRLPDHHDRKPLIPNPHVQSGHHPGLLEAPAEPVEIYTKPNVPQPRPSSGHHDGDQRLPNPSKPVAITPISEPAEATGNPLSSISEKPVATPTNSLISTPPPPPSTGVSVPSNPQGTTPSKTPQGEGNTQSPNSPGDDASSGGVQDNPSVPKGPGLNPSQIGGSSGGSQGEPNDPKLNPSGKDGSSGGVLGPPSQPPTPIVQPESGNPEGGQGTEHPSSKELPQVPKPNSNMPNGESINKALESLSSGQELTQEIADEFLFSHGTQVKSEPLAQAIRASGGEVNSMTLTRGMISGLIASPYLITGGEALSPEILEKATTAGSPKIMKALGIKKTPAELAKMGKAAATSVYGNLALAEMDVAERAAANVLGASLVGAIGTEAGQVLSEGGVEASKDFIKGFNSAVKKMVTSAKFWGWVSTGTNWTTSIIGAGLGINNAVKAAAGPPPIVVITIGYTPTISPATTTMLVTSSDTVMNPITQSLQGTNFVTIEVTKTMSTTQLSLSTLTLSEIPSSSTQAPTAINEISKAVGATETITMATGDATHLAPSNHTVSSTVSSVSSTSQTMFSSKAITESTPSSFSGPILATITPIQEIFTTKVSSTTATAPQIISQFPTDFIKTDLTISATPIAIQSSSLQVATPSNCTGSHVGDFRPTIPATPSGFTTTYTSTSAVNVSSLTDTLSALPKESATSGPSPSIATPSPGIPGSFNGTKSYNHTHNVTDWRSNAVKSKPVILSKFEDEE